MALDICFLFPNAWRTAEKIVRDVHLCVGEEGAKSVRGVAFQMGVPGRFGEGVRSVGDLDCPPVFVQRAGEDSKYLSMTANAENYVVSTGTSP